MGGVVLGLTRLVLPSKVKSFRRLRRKICERKQEIYSKEIRARELLTTTCLTVAATGAAQAASFSEGGNFGTTDQFGNSFGAVFALPAGTDRVFGAIGPTGGDNDYFAFSGLAAGPFGGIVPGDGVLVVEVLQNEQIAYYHLTLTAQSAPTSSVPEPGTVATVGLGLGAAGLAARRRKLAK